MAEEIKAPSTTQGETPKEAPATPEPPKEDLVSRASKVTLESPGPETPQQPEFFDIKKLDEIKDENLRGQLKTTYEEMNRGLQSKFQEAAEVRKQAEAQQNQSWTPERLQTELKKNDFLSSAQYLQSQQTKTNQSEGQLTDEQWSTLTPEERNVMVQQNQRTLDNQRSLNALTQEFTSMRRQQEDDRLKKAYANYDSLKVNKLQKELLSGQYKVGPEDVWKVHDYTAMAERCYQLGLQDRDVATKEKAQAISPNGISATPADDIPARGEKESGPAYFVRLANRRLVEKFGKK